MTSADDDVEHTVANENSSSFVLREESDERSMEECMKEKDDRMVGKATDLYRGDDLYLGDVDEMEKGGDHMLSESEYDGYEYEDEYGDEEEDAYMMASPIEELEFEHQRLLEILTPRHRHTNSNSSIVSSPLPSSLKQDLDQLEHIHNLIDTNFQNLEINLDKLKYQNTKDLADLDNLFGKYHRNQDEIVFLQQKLVDLKHSLREIRGLSEYENEDQETKGDDSLLENSILVDSLLDRLDYSLSRSFDERDHETSDEEISTDRVLRFKKSSSTLIDSVDEERMAVKLDSDDATDWSDEEEIISIAQKTQENTDTRLISLVILLLVVLLKVYF